VGRISQVTNLHGPLLNGVAVLPVIDILTAGCVSLRNGNTSSSPSSKSTSSTYVSFPDSNRNSYVPVPTDSRTTQIFLQPDCVPARPVTILSPRSDAQGQRLRIIATGRAGCSATQTPPISCSKRRFSDAHAIWLSFVNERSPGTEERVISETHLLPGSILRRSTSSSGA
jgi:hypothetical protein